MLTIETYLAPSPIHGLGLFNKNLIEKGTIVSYVDYRIDKYIEGTDYVGLPELTKKFLKRNGFNINGLMILFSDDGRYINHSSQPNLCYMGQLLADKVARLTYPHCFVALTNIPSGGELTIDYETFIPEQYCELIKVIERRDANVWPPKIQKIK